MDPRDRLHPLLRSRWSPTAFDPAAVVTPEDVELLLEAARWAPSAGNSQPWSFVVGLRGDTVHARLVPHLRGPVARWAPEASLLVVNLTRRTVSGSDLLYSEFADYDLGQAVAHLTVQAAAMGLHARQFRAFDLDGLTRELDPGDGVAVVSMTALGRLPAGVDPDGRAVAERERRPVR